MKRIIIGAAALAAIGLAGCTPAQIATGVQAGCAAAGVGAQVGVIVTSSVGGRPATIGGTVGGDVQKSCAAITAATSGIVDQVTSAGGTATLKMTARTRRGKHVARRVVVAPSGGVHAGPLQPIVDGFLP